MTFVPPVSFKSLKDLKSYVQVQSIEFIDLCFMGIDGASKHITLCAQEINEIDNLFISGLSLNIDLSNAVLDPFSAQQTLRVFCNYTKVDTCPRSLIEKSADAIKDHDFKASMQIKFLLTDNDTKPLKDLPDYAQSPMDSFVDIRGEIVSVLRSMGIKATHHYHAKGAGGQCVVAIDGAPFDVAANWLASARYVISNVAASYGRRVHFGGAGSLFIELSACDKDDAWFLCALGGLVRHGNSLCAISNSSPLSYCGIEDIPLGYSNDGKKAWCMTKDDSGVICMPFLCSLANPYLLFAGLAMSIFDGMKNNIHPNNPIGGDGDSNGFLPRNIAIAIDCLSDDLGFLQADDLIKEYISIKRNSLEKAYKSNCAGDVF